VPVPWNSGLLDSTLCGQERRTQRWRGTPTRALVLSIMAEAKDDEFRRNAADAQTWADKAKTR